MSPRLAILNVACACVAGSGLRLTRTPEEHGEVAGSLLRNLYELADAGAEPCDLRLIMMHAGCTFERMRKARESSRGR